MIDIDASPQPDFVQHDAPPATSTTDRSQIAITVHNVSKMYRIYDKPQDRLKQMLWRGRRDYGREFWALKDVSLEIAKGETLGIVGRNGGGKSTLLQIIAGTLAPTTGEVKVRGRLAALLELGSGFNPEFTGRDNVFLNGSILGISREEMEARFAAIEAFADIGPFIDQPVKIYSSGMFARLAFAVAVSIDPDILIVDEILAVGDIGFQQKCVNRLREMREKGMTLLFVSHSPDTLKSICNKGLFLINGKVVFWGGAEQAVDLYFNYIRDLANQEATATQHDLMTPVSIQTNVAGTMRYGTGHVQLTRVEVRNAAGMVSTAFRFGETIDLYVSFKAYISTLHLSVSFLVRDLAGIDLMGTTTFDERFDFGQIEADAERSIIFRFVNQLHAGNYGISVAINRVTQQNYGDNVLFDQIDGGAYFTTLPDLHRPVHYKFHCPVEVLVNEPSIV